MKLGILFAGQGSQYVSMGKDFYDTYEVAKKIYDEANIDFDLKDICFNGPEDLLNNTAYTQSCILATSMAIYEVLKTSGVRADFVAGLSLGEYSALCASNVLAFNDAIQIVRERGLIMANALPANTSKMVAVLNTDVDLIDDVCKAVTHDDQVCSIANYNSYNQIVITGSNKAVDEAVELLKTRGCKRAIPLKVSGAFHSPLLEEASKELLNVLCSYTFNSQEIPVVFNVSGKEESENLKELLMKQIKSSVRFYQSIEYMVDQGVDTFIEIGPGRTLTGLVKKINKSVTVMNIDKVEDVNKVLEALNDGK